MPEPKSQQNVSGRVTTDENIMRCLAENCGKELTKKYNGLEVCNKDCWDRYASDQAWEEQRASFALSLEEQRRIYCSNMGRSYGSLYRLEQAQLIL